MPFPAIKNKLSIPFYFLFVKFRSKQKNTVNTAVFKIKNCRKHRSVTVFATVSLIFSDRSVYLAGTHATSAHINRLVTSVYNRLNLFNVRLPHSAGLSVRVRNIVSERNTLLSEFTLCHFPTSSQNQMSASNANFASYYYHCYYTTIVQKLQYLFSKKLFFLFC